MKRYYGAILASLLAAASVFLASCASTGPAPVEDRSTARAPSATGTATRPSATEARENGATYRVRRGDTLYSIAFRHGVDYRELAGWNSIAAPYTIYVGQELRLAGRVPASTARGVASTPPNLPQRSAPPPARPAAAPPFEDVAAQAGSASVAVPAPGTADVSAPVKSASRAPVPETSAPATTTAPPPSAAAPAAHASSAEVAWRWPADGQVVGTYVAGDQTRQGIDIAGKAGDAVRAAADGNVVYSGNGLIGYGELIIVKHSPNFLSAYGHNRKRLVKEGDRVSAGQTIAEMGSSSASRDSLHFEIRKNGKPANPLDYLPRR